MHPLAMYTSFFKPRSLNEPSWYAYMAEKERLTAEREVAALIPGTGPLLRVLKSLKNEGTPFSLQAERPSRSSDDH